MDERDYWTRLKNGDDKAFEQLFKCLWKELYEYVARLMQSKAEAQDIVQEIFAQVWEKRFELSEVEKVRPYLYRWARHSVLNRLQAHNIHIKHLEAFRLTLEKSQDTTSQYIMESDTRDTILQIIDRLPDRMREVFFLSRIEHLSVDEIASRLNLSEQTVRNQINLAVKRLKTVITCLLMYLLQG
jgi:RNA polymerase sigma-70 factor (family 1)